VDTETQRYVDKSMDTVKAQNDARFAEVLGEIRSLGDRVAHIGSPMTWQQLALTAGSVGLILMGVVFSVLSYASDRFDGGIAASGLLDVMQAEQSKRDTVQDAKLDEILQAVGKLQPPAASQP
jgi:hypothetical protein